MYALLCLGFFLFTWTIFLYRILVNVRRENEIKRNNQEYYRRKILKLKKEVYERGQQTKKTKGG